MEILLNERTKQLVAVQKEYELVCEQQKRSLLRNEELLRDIHRLRQLTLTVVPSTKLETLKSQYLAHVTSLYPEWICSSQAVGGAMTQLQLERSSVAQASPKTDQPYLGAAIESEILQNGKRMSQNFFERDITSHAGVKFSCPVDQSSPGKAESSDIGTKPSQGKTESSDVGTKQSLSKTESSDVGTKPSLSKTESSDVGTKPSLSKTESSDVGTKPSLGKTESSDVGTKPSQGKTESSDVGTKPSLGKTESNGLQLRIPVAVPETVSYNLVLPVFVSNQSADLKADSNGGTSLLEDSNVLEVSDEGALTLEDSIEGTNLLDGSGGILDMHDDAAKGSGPLQNNTDHHRLGNDAAKGSGPLQNNTDHHRLGNDAANGSGPLQNNTDHHRLGNDAANGSGPLQNNTDHHRLGNDAAKGSGPLQNNTDHHRLGNESDRGQPCNPKQLQQKSLRSSDSTYSEDEEEECCHPDKAPIDHVQQGTPSDGGTNLSLLSGMVLYQLSTANRQLAQGRPRDTDPDMQAVCTRLLSQLKSFASSVGGILSCDEHDQNTSSIPPEAQLPSQWDPLWPSLVEHFHLLCSGGRTGEEVAALLTPALAPERSDTAEASWQLLSLLRRHGNLAAPKASSDSEHTADSSDEANVSKETTGVALNESAAYRSLVLTMGARNSDEDDDGGSSSVGLVGDDGLPIAEINDNTEGAVVTVADVTHQLPLHQRTPQSSPTSSSEDGDEASSCPVSPVYIPTAIEKRPPQQKPNAIKKLGFWSDSDPEDLELPSLKKDDNSDF